MLPDYRDIRDRIPEQPSWFDGNGVPRYGEFHPPALGVYDHYAVLVKIECQSCRRTFTVAEGCQRVVWSFKGEPITMTLENLVEGFHYGDPPIHGCVGDTMNSIPRVVLGAWHRPDMDWEPAPEYAGRDLNPEWAEA